MLSSELLGFGSDARVLIANADDFGMYPSVNTAVARSIEDGIARSCSLRPPCPGARVALRLLQEHRDIPFGVHLTLVRDFADYRWGPLTDSEKVPSLLDGTGELFTTMTKSQLLTQARIGEVELELRAQIEMVLATGLTPTHLDWHALADGGRDDDAESRAIDDGWRVRHSDLEFLTSAEAREAVQREDILIIAYDVIRHVWWRQGRRLGS